MRTKFKPSTSSRTSVRSLLIACLPTAGLGVLANSPVLGAVFNSSANQGLAIDDNAAASTNAPGTNGIGRTTNSEEHMPLPLNGIRG